MSDPGDQHPIDVAPPAEYLRQEPTRDEHLLVEQCDADASASVSWSSFAKLALRVHGVVLWVSQMDTLYRRGRRYLLAGVSATLINLATVAIWYLHRAEDSATERERVQEIVRSIDQLRLDFRELLRAALRQMSGAEPPSPSGTFDRLTSPGKLSLIEHGARSMCDATDMLP